MAADQKEGILSAYRLFNQIVQKVAPNCWVMNDDKKEILYAEACHIVREMDSYAGWDEVLDVIGPRAEWFDTTGLFLSSVLNESEIDNFVINDGFPKLRYLGYRLKEGKGILLLGNTHSDEVGTYGSGTVLNFGHVIEIGMFAEKGLYANWDSANYMAKMATGGVHINFGGYIRMGESSENSLLVQLGNRRAFGHVGRVNESKRDETVNSLSRAIKDKADALNFPRVLEKMSPETKKRVTYDLDGLKEEIFGLAGKLERCAKERYGKNE